MANIFIPCQWRNDFSVWHCQRSANTMIYQHSLRWEFWNVSGSLWCRPHRMAVWLISSDISKSLCIWLGTLPSVFGKDSSSLFFFFGQEQLSHSLLGVNRTLLWKLQTACSLTFVSVSTVDKLFKQLMFELKTLQCQVGFWIWQFITVRLASPETQLSHFVAGGLISLLLRLLGLAIITPDALEQQDH